jgi:hypothetical protein
MNESAKQQYRNKLRLMIARYAYSPSVGAWEFFNEVDNVMYHGKPDERIEDAPVTAWHDEMSRFLKENDPYSHIITTSVSHRDVEGLNDLSSIDINQRHIYKYTNGIPSILVEYSSKHGKPYVIGESGFEWDWSKNFNEFGDEMDGDFKRGLWYGLFNPTPVLPMSWWWEFFEDRGMMKYFRNVRDINHLMLQNGAPEGVALSGLDKDLFAYAVRCGKKTFVYVFNSSAERKTISFTFPHPRSKGKVRIVDADTMKEEVRRFKVGSTTGLDLPGHKLGGGQNVILIF